jgi:hypothetical protein
MPVSIHFLWPRALSQHHCMSIEVLFAITLVQDLIGMQACLQFDWLILLFIYYQGINMWRSSIIEEDDECPCEHQGFDNDLA